MDIKQIRLNNLRALISEAGTIASLARKSNTAPAYLSQILNSLPTSTGMPRSVGDKLARKLEAATNRAHGWMDRAHDETSHHESLTIHRVPLIDTSQAARAMTVMDNNLYDTQYYIPVPLKVSKRAFAIKITGDSMEPKFLQDDIIVIDPEVKPQPYDFVLSILSSQSEQVSFKQWIIDANNSLLKSLNTRYPLVELSGDDLIIGKAVYRGELL
ncbi:MAG: S24 family peptidase [Gammaproteobacteria bacterium]|nr:S24 family peptidase [Gammaproteobacteria bacterium]